MAHTKPSGLFVALITPMSADGTVECEGFRTLIDWHAEHGTSALLIMGSTGEVSMLSPDERREVVRRTLGMRRPGIAMWQGCAGNTTDMTIDQVPFAAAEGADGAIIAAPSHTCADRDAIESYARDVLDCADLAMGVYDNPRRVKTDLHWSNLLRLAEHPNMVAPKESTTRVSQVAQICAAQPDMAITCCCSPNRGRVIPTTALGGYGTANRTGNLIPREMAVISRPSNTGQDAFACQAAWLENLPVLHFAYSAINPVAVKTLMRVVGVPAGPLRRPLRPLPRTALSVALEMVTRLGLDGRYGFRTGPAALTAAEQALTVIAVGCGVMGHSTAFDLHTDGWQVGVVERARDQDKGLGPS